MKKSIVLLITAISILFICFLTKSFAQSARVVNKDTYGAYTKEGITKLINIIMAKDAEALPMLVISGQIFSVKKGTKVFTEESLILDGIVRVRPQGQAISIWLLQEDLDFEDYNNENSSQSEPNKIKDFKNNSTYRIEGIFYDKIKSTVIIKGHTHFIGDSVAGVKIIGISPDSIIVEQEGKSKILKIGDYL